MYFSIDSLSNTLSNKSHQINESSGETSSFNSKILLIKPKAIIDSKPLAKYNIKHYKQCNGCSMTHNHLSILKKIGNFSSEWICKNCSEKNRINGDCLRILNHDVEYLLEKESAQQKQLEYSSLFIFCVDTSGSMAGENLNYVKENMLKSLETLIVKSPNSKVAIVTFDSLSFYYGDGTSDKQPAITKTAFEKENPSLKDQIDALGTVSASYNSLKTLIESLTPNGGTNISNALAHCALLGAACKNAEVILCTDGATHDSDEIYFNNIALFAKAHSTRIHIVRLALSDLNLEKFACLQRETGGEFCLNTGIPHF